jgi:hypothetical protein
MRQKEPLDARVRPNIPRDVFVGDGLATKSETIEEGAEVDELASADELLWEVSCLVYATMPPLSCPAR